MNDNQQTQFLQIASKTLSIKSSCHEIISKLNLKSLGIAIKDSLCQSLSEQFSNYVSTWRIKDTD